MRLIRWRRNSPKKVWLRVEEPWGWRKVPKGCRRTAKYKDGNAHFEQRIGGLGFGISLLFIGVIWTIPDGRRRFEPLEQGSE